MRSANGDHSDWGRVANRSDRSNSGHPMPWRVDELYSISRTVYNATNKTLNISIQTLSDLDSRSFINIASYLRLLSQQMHWKAACEKTLKGVRWYLIKQPNIVSLSYRNRQQGLRGLKDPIPPVIFHQRRHWHLQRGSPYSSDWPLTWITKGHKKCGPRRKLNSWDGQTIYSANRKNHRSMGSNVPQPLEKLLQTTALTRQYGAPDSLAFFFKPTHRDHIVK